MKLSRLVSSALCIAAIVSSLGAGVHAMPVSGETRGSVLHVKPIAKSGDCSSWENACELQSALARAVGGDELWVMAGTYKPTLINDRSVSFVLVSGVAIYGGFTGMETERDQRDWAVNPTILSGDLGVVGDISDNSYHVVYSSAVNSSTLLDGFTISFGNANGTSTASYGGGMLNFINGSPTLTNIIFSANSAENGGGMFIYESDPTLTNVTFIGNSASQFGGGMYINVSSSRLTNVTFSSNSAVFSGGGMFNVNSNLELTKVIFSDNSAQYGGGIHNIHSSPTLTNVTFFYNSAEYGGGMSNYNGNPILTKVTFSTNSADIDGGGMYNEFSDPKLKNVTFSDNSAGNRGGGMSNWSNSSATLTNVTFSSNSADWGGGMVNFESDPILTNITFSSNSASFGGGVFNYESIPILTNALLWGNSPDQIVNTGSAPVVTYSIIQGGYAGEGNINSNPLLGPLADNGGFTQTHALLTGSPAIDAGSPTACPAADQRGYHRPIDGNDDGVARCDMGAYEYGSYFPYYSYLPLIVK